MPIAEIEKLMKRTIEHYKLSNSPICDNFNLVMSKEVLFQIFKKVSDKYRKAGIIRSVLF